MNPILILRTEIVCLILLVYLAYITRSFRMGKDGKIFNLIMTFSMVHIVMDGITVWTVNHRDTTLPFLNTAAHIVFYLSAMLFSVEILTYVVNLCKPEWTQKARMAADSLVAACLAAPASGPTGSRNARARSRAGPTGKRNRLRRRDRQRRSSAAAGQR